MNMHNLSSVSSSMRLDDFPSGWKRHQDHSGIVLIEPGYKDIFLVAANDESCKAAILAFQEDQKYADREAFRQAVLKTREASEDVMGIDYSVKGGFHKQYGHLESAMPQIRDISFDHVHMSGDTEIVTSIIEDFGQSSVGEQHPKHSRPVSNRVFFAGGTLLETSEGWFPVPEADALYMKEGVKHEPNLEKIEGADFNKLLVVSRSAWMCNYD